MINGKPFLLTALITLFSLHSYSQETTDSTEIDDDKDTIIQIVQINTTKARKRGVYKTYEEYLNDSPSVDAEFTSTPLRLSRKSDLIVEAAVDYKEKRPKKIWGISDGEHVYIRATAGQFFKNHYYKLQCDGPVPYVYYAEKLILVPMGLGAVVAVGVAAGTASLPPSVTIMIVKESTNYISPLVTLSKARVKKYLAEYPDLLQAYLKEGSPHIKTTKVRYMTEYNKRKLGETSKN